MRKGEEKKQDILAAAERLFCAKGYRETSVQDILDVLKTSKGSFYHHFESKEMVLSTLCAQRAEKAAVNAQLQSLSEPLEKTDRLNALFHAMMPLRREETTFLAMLLPQLFTQEGKMVCYAYQEALKEAFQPLIARELYRAGREETIYTPGHGDVSGIVADLVNDCWLACAELMVENIRTARTADTVALQSVLSNYRAVMERLLDAPWGSMEIIRLEEWIETARQLERKMILA